MGVLCVCLYNVFVVLEFSQNNFSFFFWEEGDALAEEKISAEAKMYHTVLGSPDCSFKIHP